MNRALLDPGLTHVPKAEIWKGYRGQEAHAESCLMIHIERARSRLVLPAANHNQKTWYMYLYVPGIFRPQSRQSPGLTHSREYVQKHAPVTVTSLPTFRQ